LSQCTRNALIGAGVGAVIGGTQGPRENRVENAALGAAAGGLATYGVCRWLTAREQQRVENAYYQSLNSGQPYNDSWQSDQGGTRSLAVSRPTQASGYGPECRRVSATISSPVIGCVSVATFMVGLDGELSAISSRLSALRRHGLSPPRAARAAGRPAQGRPKSREDPAAARAAR
jgi:surface antigen